MRKGLSWALPAGIAALFFAWVVTPPSYFNFLPYAIHEGLLQGSGYEAEFIVAFDFCAAVALFFGVRAIVKPMLMKPPE